MPISIRDVAREAGVSVGTVSRALNGYSDIREETKENILAVAKRLGYVPNLNAKNLAAKNRRIMAVILAGFMADRGLSDEVVIKMLRGTCKYAIDHDMEMATYVISSEQQETKTFEQFCSEHSLAGAVCFGLRTSDVYYECLQSSRTPCVTVDVQIEGENVGYVGTDNTKACYEMTQRVLAKNHKRIVFLNGRNEAAVCAERLQGVNAALRQHGLTLEANLYTDFRADRAEEIVCQYLSEHRNERATAFICASDFIALGASRGIRRSGYQVGQDFAVTGFDGLHIAAFHDPILETVDQNMEQKGFAAAEMLLDIVEGRSSNRIRMIPYTIREGESVSVLDKTRKIRRAALSY